MMQFSVVLPAKDEADNIDSLLNEIHQALQGKAHEIIVVDDGSSDGTGDVVKRTAETLACPVQLITHQQACGQSTALYTAVQHARGDWIVVLDADGQNDPADIPNLYERVQTIDAKHLCVIGHRQKRKDTPWKRFQSRIANRFRAFVLRDETPDTGCGLKILPRHTYLQLPYFHHMHRFIPALVRRMGGSVQSVAVNHRPRTQGVSKYNAWNRFWAGLLDIMGVLWLIHRSRQPKVANLERLNDEDSR
ncbi:dolichol-phosphate mannosyltransferase [Idiomarina tyrosinivorans]|uniref:Dolichol-phosphate mannosyltransferase n=1 Tax=Idiomarina tyrosinivorans TaxID=1445662 RepID=A0A432ZPS8_9GAMM|nr:glycosyltransferase family 2 protein [Idiomarina tyrosinivorans]RUO79900.1 dolichol-phosphate mannosyltransferase [Idiomarina tyrosinivorans]